MVYKNINLPEGIRAEALEFVKRLIDNLDSSMTLSLNDEMSYYLLANAYSNYLNAQDDLNENGFTYLSDRGNESPRASVRIAKDNHILILNLLKEMSGTIRSRSVVKQIAQETNDSPLKALINEFKED